MTELKDRFALADQIGTKDLWDEARRRAAAADGATRPGAVDWPPSSVRRVAIGALAFAVFVTAAVFAWQLSPPERAPGPPRPVAIEPVDLATELGPGWTELPGPPELLGGTAVAWTGSELLLWGGEADADVLAEEGFGFSFDAESRTWSMFPDGPLSPRLGASSAWTGRELLVWGGRTGGCCVPEEFFGDGAAYDPSSRTWRMLAPAPIQARSPFSVWTGQELLVWGSQDRDVRFVDGAAYDPASDTWRTIADGPVEITDGTAVWTRSEMIVFGAALHGGNIPESETAIGAAYDPATDRWRELPSSIETNPNANTAVWTDGRLVAIDYDSDAEVYDPSTDRWTQLQPMPLEDGEDVPRAAYADGWTVVNFFGQVATFSSVSQQWTNLTDGVPWREPPIGSPIAAGGAFLLPVRSSELSEQPSVEFDTRLLVWVPPSEQIGEIAEPSLFVPETTVVGTDTRMPVVFPDGSRATLVYPISLDLASLGVQPDVSYLYRDNAGPEDRFEIIFLHDPNASIGEYVDGIEPIVTINGGAEIWPMSEKWDVRNQVQGVWIRLGLKSWTVLVASMNVAEAVSVADYLRVLETPAGFPIVTAVGPLGLAEGFGETEGPTLSVADAFPDPDESSIDVIFLSPDGCNAESGASGTYGSLCLADENVFASIYGDREFVTDVFEGLQVEDFRRA